MLDVISWVMATFHEPDWRPAADTDLPPAVAMLFASFDHAQVVSHQLMASYGWRSYLAESGFGMKEAAAFVEIAARSYQDSIYICDIEVVSRGHRARRQIPPPEARRVARLPLEVGEIHDAWLSCVDTCITLPDTQVLTVNLGISDCNVLVGRLDLLESILGPQSLQQAWEEWDESLRQSTGRERRFLDAITEHYIPFGPPSSPRPRGED